MYKVFIIGENSQIQGCIDEINKVHGRINFVSDSKYYMYIFYEVPDFGSDI